MKVVICGFRRTGTKSTAEALRILGYDVWDYMETFEYHREQWKKIIDLGSTPEDFRQMYEDVDAVADWPPCFFWENILEAFPDAKLIFTVRDEDKWLASTKTLIQTKNNSRVRKLLYTITLTGRRFHLFCKKYDLLFYDTLRTYPWDNMQFKENVLRLRYREHNAHVLMNAPKDKLLVFQPSHGWEPLCKFLNKEIPSVKFPHVNKGFSWYDEMLQSHPVGKRMKREAFLLAGCLTCVFSMITFYFFA